MNKNKIAEYGEKPDPVDQVLRQQAESVKPDATFIERLAARLRREYKPGVERVKRRFPIWGYAAAIAALVIAVFVVRGLWPGQVIPAQPTEVTVSPWTPDVEPTRQPTDVPPPTPTQPPTPEPEPSFAADLPPAVAKAIPRPGEEVDAKAGILLRFTQAMDKESVENAVKVQPAVEGEFVWEDDRTVTFKPKALASGVRYHVLVGADAYATNGLPLSSELAFNFSTIGPLDVTHAAPVDLTTDVRSDSPLIVSFNYPMVPMHCTGSVADQDGQCGALPVQINPNITGQGMWVNTSVYRFDPLPGWDAGTTYQVTLQAGLKSVGSAELPEVFAWSFETALPRVVEISPASRETDVPLDTSVSVRFNTPMSTRVTEQAFDLVDEGGNSISGVFAWAHENTEVVFTPTQLLALDTAYTVRIAGTAQSVNGAELGQAERVGFITTPPPSIIRIGGVDEVDSRVIDYYEPVRVEFNGLIDPETIEEHITVTDAGEIVGANVWWNTYQETPAAYISWDKTPGAEYCITVNEGISDLYGNTIDEAAHRCFIGGDLPSIFTLATQMEGLTLDAAEPARFYFVAVNIDYANFRLERLNEINFVDYENRPGEILRQWSMTFGGPRNEVQTIPVDLTESGQPLPTGFYQIVWDSDTDRWGPRRMRFAVIDRHVTLKTAEDEALVWVTELRSATPIEGAPVHVVARTGVVLGSGITDADGIARFLITPGTDRYDANIAVMGEPGAQGFGVASSDWNRSVSPWNFDIRSNYRQAPDYVLYLHTDRPIYRPGQSVYFRGIVRADDDVTYSLPPEGTQVDLKLYDAYHDIVSQLTLETSTSGIFDGSFALPVDGKLGVYSLNVEMAGQTEGSTSVQFTVAAYRKPEFEVVVVPEHPGILSGSDAQVLVEANYYAGGAVSHARLHWILRAEPYTFNPDVAGWWNWGFDPFGWPWWQEPEVLAEGDATTAANGKFLWQHPVDLQPLGNQDEAGPQNWVLEVTVTDEAGLPVTGSEAWVVHPGAFYLGLKPRSWVAYAGKASDVDMLALDWEGLPIKEQTVRVQLAKREWEMIPATEAFASPEWIYTDEIEDNLTVTTDAAGKAVVTVTPSESGSYVVIAESTDQYGNVIRSETYLWVSGKERAVWQQPENQVKPVADARSYKPGDVARILLPTSFDPSYEVLVTVERAGILHAERLTMGESNPVVEIPIRDDYVPNVVVSFVAVKGVTSEQSTPDVRIGMVELEVDPVNRLMDVEVDAVCDAVDDGGCIYEPGDQAVLNIRTLDANGSPVQADVAVAVVDKAVLALAAPDTRTLKQAFYASRPLRVSTGDGLITLFNRSLANLERLSQQASQIAKEMLFGGIGGGGGGAAYQADVREDFPDTALWEAQLQTGDDGTAQVRVDLPDSLTTWVVDVRAITDQSLVGQGSAEFIVSKPLMVRPVTPRFFTAGDAAAVAAVVHNNTDSDMDVTLRLEAAGIDIVDGQDQTQTVRVAAHGRQRVTWKVRVPLYGSEFAQLTFYAEGGGFRDAARPSVGRESDHALPVYRYESPEVFGTAGQLTDAGTRLEAIVIPPEAGPDSTLTLRLDPTLAAGMLDSLRYLEHFPHECNEQLVSRFLPNVVSYLALKDLGYQDSELENRLWELISKALNRLYSLQQRDGGWGWWSEASDFQVSAYVALGLLQAQRTGYTVDWKALDAVMNYLVGTLDEDLRAEQYTSNQAFALYVLSEGGYEWPTSADEILFEARGQLDISGKAFLALALGLRDADDSRIPTLLEDLRGDAEITASGVHWEGETGVEWQTWTRTTAVVMDAFARLAPEDPLIPQAVRWLMIARKADRWETTQETVWAVIGLTDAMVATGELEADYSWGVALNLETVGEGQVTQETLRYPVELSAQAVDLLREWPNALEISRGEGEGVLYYTANLKVYLPVEDLEAENRGISVERQYCVYSPVSDSPSKPGDDFVPCVPVTSAKPGDLIEVRLTLTLPRMRNYLVLEDPYPAGMEPVDPNLATESDLLLEPETKREGSQFWWYPTFTHSELRDERAVYYATSLTSGTYQARYLLRAAFPGEYKVLPATAGEMYFPSVYGRSEGSVFTIEP
jgi:uncharacterized protein YfaS (alpha-2-macroglobulin family)